MRLNKTPHTNKVLLPAVLPAVSRYGWNSGKTRKTNLVRLTLKNLQLFFFNFRRASVIFVGPLIPLFRTTGNICPELQSQGGSPCLPASQLCTTKSSDSALLRHLLTSWWPAWQLSCSDPYTFKQALVGLESGIYATVTHHVTRQTLY